MTGPQRKTNVRTPSQGAHAKAPPAGMHDIGGLDFGAIDKSDHDLALWERRVDAMMILLYAKKGLFTVDAMRRSIEDYAGQTYDKTEYYEKWVRAMRNLLIEQEVLTSEEVEAAIERVRERHAAAGRAVADARVPWDF